jgi:hypothetical protein
MEADSGGRLAHREPDHGQAGGEGAETRLELGNKDGRRKLLQP